MKVGFETMLISYICMFFLGIGLYFMNILFTHQGALQVQEYAVMMIEHHNAYDDMVQNAIDKKTQGTDFRVQVRPVGDTYSVSVTYTVNAPFLRQHLSKTLYTLCVSR